MTSSAWYGGHLAGLRWLLYLLYDEVMQQTDWYGYSYDEKTRNVVPLLFFHLNSTTESTLPVDDPFTAINSSGTLRSIHVHFQSCTAGWHIVGVCSNLLIMAHCRLIYDSLGQTLDTQGGIGTRNNAYANTSLHPLVSRVCCRYSGADSTCHLAVRVMP